MIPESSYDANGLQWAWDATSLKAATACPRYYQYSILESWKPRFPSVHLWFGGHYAKALERFHKFQASGLAQQTALEEVLTLVLTETWNHDLDETGNRIPGTGGPATFDNNIKNRDTLIRTIIWYFESFADDHYTTYVSANGEAAVELSFKINVDDGLLFTGHLDRLCYDPQQELFVHDQKTTTTALGPYYFKQFKPDIQFSMYTFAGSMIFDMPVKGVIVDAAQVAVGFSRFARIPTYRTEDEINEWYDEMMLLANQIRQYGIDNFYPRNTASCSNYGGCMFREVCSRPPEVRANFLAADFDRGEKWEPIRNR